MRVTLEYITPNAESFIGRMSSICYNSSVEPDACIRRAAKCADEGHLATLRFAHAVFNVKEISRACSHQFVRSKHLDFLQRSQRYCKELDENVYRPDTLDIDQLIDYHGAIEVAQSVYRKLLEQGVKKEDARFVLPEATFTELNVVGNMQAWKDFIHLRLDKHAQKEIRDVALTINNILAEECSNLFTRHDGSF